MRAQLKTQRQIDIIITLKILRLVAQKAGRTVQWTAIFPTFVELAVGRYCLKLTFGFFNSNFLRLILASR